MNINNLVVGQHSPRGESCVLGMVNLQDVHVGDC